MHTYAYVASLGCDWLLSFYVVISRDVVLGTCTCTRVVLEYKSRVLVIVLVLALGPWYLYLYLPL